MKISKTMKSGMQIQVTISKQQLPNVVYPYILLQIFSSPVIPQKLYTLRFCKNKTTHLMAVLPSVVKVVV